MVSRVVRQCLMAVRYRCGQAQQDLAQRRAARTAVAQEQAAARAAQLSAEAIRIDQVLVRHNATCAAEQNRLRAKGQI